MIKDNCEWYIICLYKREIVINNLCNSSNLIGTHRIDFCILYILSYQYLYYWFMHYVIFLTVHKCDKIHIKKRVDWTRVFFIYLDFNYIHHVSSWELVWYQWGFQRKGNRRQYNECQYTVIIIITMFDYLSIFQ